jgi:phosphoribosylformimino-5-aminoimidazole carboxamide ribotide isomerase
VIVIPAIDIRGGRVVRLTRGRPDEETVYAEDPTKVAERFAAAGAEWLHVVDLDAALGNGENRETVLRTIGSVGVSVQVGGGLRSRKAVEEVLEAGAARVVLGTEAVRNLDFLEDMVNGFGERIVVALDTDGERVRIEGWTQAAGRIEYALPALARAGAPRFLVTAIDRDGTLQGSDVALYRRVIDLSDRPVLASGGVAYGPDLSSLAALGVEGVVVGKALYEGTLSLHDAFAVAR